MAVVTVKELIERLSKKNPDEIIWYTFCTREAIIDDIVDMEFEDEQGNLYERDRVTEIVTDEVATTLFNSIDNDDDMWERISETFRDYTQDSFLEQLPDKETEIEKELWDK